MSDLNKAIEQDARWIEERIPSNMDTAEIKQARQRARDFIAERRLTQAQVAKKIGVSTARLNQFLAGKYQGDVPKIVVTVLRYIDSVKRKERHGKAADSIQTTVAERIYTTIVQTEAMSDHEGKIGLIFGDAGHGKSHCLRAYARSNPNSVYVELDDTMTSTRIFAEIAAALKYDSSGSLANLTQRLIENLQNRQMIVMLDEASSLTVRQLNQLRQILVVKARCPLILAGNRYLWDTIMQPTARRGHESLDQFITRLMGKLDLDKEAADDDGGLYTEDDVLKLYQYGGIRLTSDAVRALRKICQTPYSGRLRTCSHIIAALHIAPQIVEAGQITAENIRSAIQSLGLPVNVRLPMATINKQAAERRSIAAAG